MTKDIPAASDGIAFKENYCIHNDHTDYARDRHEEMQQHKNQVSRHKEVVSLSLVHICPVLIGPMSLNAKRGRMAAVRKTPHTSRVLVSPIFEKYSETSFTY